MSRRIGIIGGSFDPFHNGHVDLGTVAQQALDLTRLFVIPSHIPPHRPQPMTSTFHRFAMAAMAVAGRPGWRVADIELRFGTPSYTSGTLGRFRERGYPPSDLFFVLGADAFSDIENWMDYPRILDATHFAVVSRPGFPVGELPLRLPQLTSRMVRPPVDQWTAMDPLILLIDAPTADVSSTAIRRRLAEGQSIAGLVPPGVQQHIEQHGLYSSTAHGRRVSDAPPAQQAGRLHGQD